MILKEWQDQFDEWDNTIQIGHCGDDDGSFVHGEYNRLSTCLEDLKYIYRVQENGMFIDKKLLERVEFWLDMWYDHFDGDKDQTEDLKATLEAVRNLRKV